MGNFFEYSQTVKYDASEDTQESGGVAKLQSLMFLSKAGNS